MQEKDEDYDSPSDEMYQELEIDVDRKQRPIRIDKYLMGRLEHTSRNRIQQAIKSGSILVDKEEVKPNYKVRPGDQISVIIPRPPGYTGKLLPQKIPLDIRYEDEDLLIVHKPAGMVVHPGIGHHSGTLVNALAWHFGSGNLPVLNNNYQDRMGLVHRIDKNTSGLLVVAKNEFAMSHLAKQFYYHTIDRTYYALIWGEPDPLTGSIEGNVGRHPRYRKQFTVFPEGDQGKWALTHFRTLEALYYVSLVECKLETGRTHQIRVHFKHLGHPLFADEKYGGDRICKGTIFSKYKSFVENTFNVLPRHALHAKSLGFVHPRTKEDMFFDSELPDDFQQALERWRRYLKARQTGGNLD